MGASSSSATDSPAESTAAAGISRTSASRCPGNNTLECAHMRFIATRQLSRETGQTLDAFYAQFAFFTQQTGFQLIECANGQLDGMADGCV